MKFYPLNHHLAQLYSKGTRRGNRPKNRSFFHPSVKAEIAREKERGKRWGVERNEGPLCKKKKKVFCKKRDAFSRSLRETVEEIQRSPLPSRTASDEPTGQAFNLGAGLQPSIAIDSRLHKERDSEGSKRSAKGAPRRSSGRSSSDGPSKETPALS